MRSLTQSSAPPAAVKAAIGSRHGLKAAHWGSSVPTGSSSRDDASGGRAATVRGCCLPRLRCRLCLVRQLVPRQLEGAAGLSRQLLCCQHAADGMLARAAEHELEPSTMPDICLGSAPAASCHKSLDEFLAVHMSVNPDRHGDHGFRYSAAFQMTLKIQGDCACMKRSCCGSRWKENSIH